MMKNGNQNVKSTLEYLVLAAFLGIWGACGGDESASEQDQKDAEAMAPQEIDPEEQTNPPGGE